MSTDPGMPPPTYDIGDFGHRPGDPIGAALDRILAVADRDHGPTTPIAVMVPHDFVAGGPPIHLGRSRVTIQGRS